MEKVRRNRRWMRMSLVFVFGLCVWLRWEGRRYGLGAGFMQETGQQQKVQKRERAVDSGTDSVLYFGYGSNLRRTRIQLSSGGADLVATAALAGFCLGFTTWSRRWTGGAADVKPCENGTVLGAVWSLPVADLPALDSQESVNEGSYYRFQTTVYTLAPTSSPHAKGISAGTPLSVFIYRVTHPQPGLKPSRLYLRVIISGARRIGLPQWYIRNLEAIQTSSYDSDELFSFYNTDRD